jgi:FkbM family methyltransferase
MGIITNIKQYYRYLRIWKKLQKRVVDDYPQEVFDFYSGFLPKDGLCFDVGANIGDKTDLFLRLGAKVIAVEPQRSCQLVLKRRFKNSDVVIEPVVLADQSGFKKIYLGRSHTLTTTSEDWISTVKQSGRFSKHKWKDAIEVQASTLDELILKHGIPDYCKIDVEGSEFEVLRGLSRPVKTISLEFVTERIDASLRCIDYLSGLGDTKYNYCIGAASSLQLSEWVDSCRMKEMLQKMEKRLENYGELYVQFTA